MKYLPFGLSKKDLTKRIEKLPVPPGEEEGAFRQRVKAQLVQLWRLQIFQDINEALGIAANWARETPTN